MAFLNHESLLIDVSPSDGNSLSFMKSFTPIINVANMIDKEIEVKAYFVYPNNPEPIFEKKVEAKKFTSIEVSCGELDYNRVNETKLVIEATVPSNPGAIQRVNVSLSCLPRQVQTGQYQGLIRFEIQGVGVNKVIERTQQATMSPEQVEEESKKEVADYNKEKIEILKDGMAMRFGSQPVIEGKRLDNEMFKQEKLEKLDGAKEEFENLIMFMNAFEKKFFDEHGHHGYQDGTKDNIFDMENACETLFKRMRALENKFFRKFDKMKNLGHSSETI